MRFPSDQTPPTTAPVPKRTVAVTIKKVAAKVLTPLARSIGAVPDGTLRYLMGNPVDFDAQRTRKDFLAWADERGRSNDSDWRFAWQRYLEVQAGERIASVPVRTPSLVKKADGGFKISTLPPAPPAPTSRESHRWAARMTRKAAA